MPNKAKTPATKFTTLVNKSTPYQKNSDSESVTVCFVFISSNVICIFFLYLREAQEAIKATIKKIQPRITKTYSIKEN